MNITKAKYQSSPTGDNNNTVIEATINDQEWSVPVDTANRYYQAIQEWVAEGNTIADAD